MLTFNRDRTQDVAQQIANLSTRVEENRLEKQAEDTGKSYKQLADTALS